MRIIAISALPIWVMGDKKGFPSIYHGVKAFAEAGHEVHFITPQFGITRRGSESARKPQPLDETYDGIRIHRFKIPIVALLRLMNRDLPTGGRILRYPMHLLRFLSLACVWLLFTAGALRRARLIAKAGAPDVVYAHNDMAVASAYLLARKYRIPNITRLYGTFLSEVPWHALRLLMYFTEVLAFKIPCDYLIITNDGTRGDAVAARCGVPPDRVKYWVNGVNKTYDPSRTLEEAKKGLGIPPETKVVLTVCRLDWWKRVDRIVKAVPDIVAVYPDVLFLIVGDGGEKDTLTKLSNALAVERWVRFEGAVPHASVREYMYAADIFLSTQELSNLGNSMLDAMVCGRCIVTLSNGDIGGFIRDDWNGVLLDEDKLELLPKTVIDVLRDDERRRRVGLNARLFADQTLPTWEERVKTEVTLVEELCRRKAAAT